VPVKDEVVNWLEEARADLRRAENSVKLDDYELACLTAHRATEKALKALILHVFGVYARGHDLLKLYRRVRGHVEIGISESSLTKLIEYYALARYPSTSLGEPSEEITKKQAIEAISIARSVIDEITRAIKDP